ncbi:ATP-binding protein [Acidovorax sp.]|uniref:ATP-binding protein n=1 Tax=Acidovorax sp. TaxID=1872122 RepID=UPI003D0943E2
MSKEPTYLGSVSSVAGSSLTVELAQQVNSGLLIIGGKTHRVGQVGSFVRIPQGYNNLYGLIAETSESSSVGELSEAHETDRRWIKVELVGETIGEEFERGISQYPSINDEAHLVVESDLRKIYGGANSGQIIVGTLSSSDSIKVSIDLDKLVTRHSAVLGSTGSGKSTSVSSLLRSIVTDEHGATSYPGARIVLIDIHGEYSAALGDIASVFSVIPKTGENKLHIPYWCVSSENLIDFLCGSVSEGNKSLIFDRIVEQKVAFVTKNAVAGIDLERISADTPIPFNLKQIWHDLMVYDNANWEDKEKTVPSYMDKGDAETLSPPKFKPPGASSNAPHKGNGGIMKRQLDLMRSRLLDNQFAFFMSPGDWQPDLSLKVQKDLPDLIKDWLGHDKPITILDLSGMPSARLDLLLGSVLDIIFESALWGRNSKEGMKNRPVLLVLEEAHRYLSSGSVGLAKGMVQKIAKEGRKFGVGAMLVSQRPSEIDETILSQCGTLFALRINNATDRNRVKSAMSEGISGIVDSLPVLRTGEAIIAGEAARLPMRCRFKLPRDGHFPDSKDPVVAASWSKPIGQEDYSVLVSAWRNQNPSSAQ